VRRAALCALLLACVAPARGQPNFPSPLNTYTFEQHVGQTVPLELPFVDAQGRAVTLGDYFGRRPVVLVMAQYRCPMLCNQVLNGLVDSLHGVSGNAGEAFEVVVVSFDWREKPELAAAKKRTYVEDYARPGAERGWHFLTGEQPAITRLAEVVGFRFAYSASTDSFAHPSGVVVLTSRGQISQYFYGILYNRGQMQQALETAARGDLGQVVAPYMRVLMLCYDFDASSGKYVVTPLGLVRLGGVLTVLAIVIGLPVSWWRERRARRLREAAQREVAHGA
jgi:protein SCO1/2